MIFTEEAYYRYSNNHEDCFYCMVSDDDIVRFHFYLNLPIFSFYENHIIKIKNIGMKLFLNEIFEDPEGQIRYHENVLIGLDHFLFSFDDNFLLKSYYSIIIFEKLLRRVSVHIRIVRRKKRKLQRNLKFNGKDA